MEMETEEAAEAEEDDLGILEAGKAEVEEEATEAVEAEEEEVSEAEAEEEALEAVAEAEEDSQVREAGATEEKEEALEAVAEVEEGDLAGVQEVSAATAGELAADADEGNCSIITANEFYKT